MSWLLICLVIFVTSLLAMLVAAYRNGEADRKRLGQEARQEPPAPELPRAAPFPVDTGPILLQSDLDAANAEIGPWTRARISETDWLIRAGEREIGPTP